MTSQGGAGGGGGLRGTWSSTPAPVMKVDGRVLLCSLADLPRDLPVGIPGRSGTTEETAFVIVDESDAPSDDTHARGGSLIRPNDADAPSDGAALGESGDPSSSRVLRVRLPAGKRGQHVFLHDVLPGTTSFASTHLSLGRAICVASGGDAGVGVALVLLQLFFDDAGKPRSALGGDVAVSKNSVRTRLEWIIASRPQTNPSRAILKRTNEFLLSTHSRRGDAEFGATVQL